MMTRKFRHGDHIIDLAARRDGDRIAVFDAGGEHNFVWHELRPGEYLLRRDGRQWRCIVARDGDERWIWIDGTIHHLRVEAQGRKRAATASGELVAPMPGQVLRVLVAAGAVVRKDQTLVVLEAMKMQYEIASPRDGVVRHVHAAAGAQVSGGVALVTLEDENENGRAP